VVAARRSAIDGRYIRNDEWLSWETYWTPTHPEVPCAVPMVNGAGFERCTECGRDVIEMFDLPALGTRSAIRALCLECAKKVIAMNTKRGSLCPRCGFPSVTTVWNKGKRHEECMFGHKWGEDGRLPIRRRKGKGRYEVLDTWCRV